jgi:hypothetical protein
VDVTRVLESRNAHTKLLFLSNKGSLIPIYSSRLEGADGPFGSRESWGELCREGLDGQGIGVPTSYSYQSGMKGKYVKILHRHFTVWWAGMNVL